MSARLAPLALVLALALAACGDDSTGPEDVDLSGSWTYSATIEQEDAESCRIEDAPLTLEQNGDLLSGTIEIGTIQCGNVTCDDGTLESVALDSGRHRDGGRVEFEALFLDHQGIASSDRLEGDLLADRIELSGCSDEGAFVAVIESGPGTWEATR